MADQHAQELVPIGDVHDETQRRIFEVRGRRVVLDSDLAEFYGVETRALNQQVTRNAARFPEDFSFRLTAEEVENLKSQIVISSDGHGGRRRALPRVFTEHGVLALSGVLRSPRATEVSIAVTRAFITMREQLEDVQVVLERLAAFEVEQQALRQDVEELKEIKQLAQDNHVDLDAMIDHSSELAGIIEDFERRLKRVEGRGGRSTGSR